MTFFFVSERKIFCAINVSDNCKGMLGPYDCFEDDDEQVWNVCLPCAEQARVTPEQLVKIRRTDY